MEGAAEAYLKVNNPTGIPVYGSEDDITKNYNYLYNTVASAYPPGVLTLQQ
jgi:hypothetical protein